MSLGSQRWLTQWTGRPMPAMQDWFVKAWTLVEDRIGTGLNSAQRDVVIRFGRSLSDWTAAAPEPFTLVHLDYRLDNFLFADDRIWVVDWQTVGWGSPGWDLAYLIGTSVEPEHGAFGLDAVAVDEHDGLANGLSCVRRAGADPSPPRPGRAGCGRRRNTCHECWGSGPPPNVEQRIAEAEALGVDSFWTAETYGSDALTPLA